MCSLPVKYLINTHWHFDHVENNETFASQGAIIISHVNCRNRLSEDQALPTFNLQQEASLKVSLPKITFQDSLNIHIDNEIVNVFHLQNAHTNSDAVVSFQNSNIIHMGDIFVRYGMPFIDVANGGTLNGMISACEYVSTLSNSKTQIIPGHGPVSNKQDLIQYADMLKTIRNRIVEAINVGHNLEQFIESKPAEENNSIIGKEKLLELYYISMQKENN
jgi:glyoxylase-like metal-dependent hydrolase (beta-lactamase superfamily II)